MSETAVDVILAGLATQIKELRLERGWTQEDLALEAGAQQQTVSRYESQLAAKRSLEFLTRLAHAFGVRVEVRFVP